MPHPTTTTADALIEALHALHPKGFDLSLGRILRLLERLGNPHLQLPPVIHVAGTNGKGSATAFARALLEAAGYTVHVHSSPHLVRWHERYRLATLKGGRYVEDSVLVEALQRVIHANGQDHITVFEIMTAVAFVLFSQHPADAAILEVGLGGRLDATNVIENPAVSLIMSISLDHQAYLGESLAEIAVEKAGIIKKNKPVVIGCQQTPAIYEMLAEKAEALHAPCHIFNQDYQAFQEHGRMVFQNAKGLMDLPCPVLYGDFQIANAAAAIQAVQLAGFPLDEKNAARAMQSVEWPARLQKLKNGKLKDMLPPLAELWLDGGHNPEAGQMIAAFLQQRKRENNCSIILICGMINTKDVAGYMHNFKDCVSCIYTVPVGMSEAGIDARELAKTAHQTGISAEATHNLHEALQRSITRSTDNNKPLLVMICGSLYLAGEALEYNETPPV